MKEKRCSIEGCEGKHIEKGFCGKHYQRIRHGVNNMCVENLIHGPGPIKSGSLNPRWNGGNSEYPNHSQMKKIRLEVLKEANYICQFCGGVAVEIHHKDLSKNNHSKDNLKACCHKCNSQIRKPHTSKYKRRYGYFGYELNEMGFLKDIQLMQKSLNNEGYQPIENLMVLR